MEKLIQQKFYVTEQYVKSLFWSFVLIIPLSYVEFYFIQTSYALVDWVIPIVVALIFGLGMGYLSKRSEVHKKERALFKAVVDFSLEFTFVRNVEGKYEFVSPAVEDLTGYSPEDFYKTPNFMDSIIHPEDRYDWSSHVHNVNDDGKPEKVELRIFTKQGEVRWLEHLCGPIHNSSGEIIGVRSTNIDITERKLSAQKLERLGFYDPLTDLPNRRYLNEYMSKLIAKNEQRDANEKFAVFFVDLNRFKYVNDAHGHSVGDQLLKEVARRFKSSCLESKQAMITRFGGDEFVFVTKQAVTTESIQECVAQMNVLLEAPFRIQGYKLSIGVTAGIAVYPQDGLTPEILIKNSDAAMYKAKSQGLSMAFFSHEMTEHATEMVDLQSRLRGALNRGLIKPFYQPLIDLKTGKTIGVEVLARWVTDDGSIGPSPAVFIPVSEETGLIGALSETMIAQACNDIVRWQQEGVQIKYSINVSARQFADDNFCTEAFAQFERLGVDPKTVQIELTESVLLNNTERSLQKIQELKARGFLIALDDFGTGFASLHYLTLFPFDTLKVDRAFVTNIIEDKRQFAIAKSIINLAHDLDLVVVAEGIETEEQRQVLFDLGCDVGQGYLFSRPVAPDFLSNLLVA
ncbi:putative bifunctional diguanylate cyclase/phosphodiesterase [Thiomicrorhabdus lithotrophica]|uniref:EAL domain-containing protein n=1 Tax=Thiomicrorhabdus lithotrophica TaxID=2949997 RepID=A0ABY8CB38_9GAMM|nr:GGDEF domain-containing phosphodiesterase [Thiomicrorhabdus lithotrophica]WEJ63179.1 EAL domain-containing protein [Thiomicrorhabdus lithotrophica]